MNMGIKEDLRMQKFEMYIDSILDILRISACVMLSPISASGLPDANSAVKLIACSFVVVAISSSPSI